MLFYISIDLLNKTKSPLASEGINGILSLTNAPKLGEEMPKAFTIVDYGLIIFEPSFSSKESSLSKNVEVLSMRIPVLTNAGVGDLETILAEKPTGIIVHDFSEKEMLKAWQALVENDYLSEDFNDQAKKWYDLNQGINNYCYVYNKFLL